MIYRIEEPEPVTGHEHGLEYKEVPKAGTWHVAHGREYCGYFIQFYPLDEEAQKICNEIGDGECLNLNSLFGDLIPDHYLAVLYEFDINQYI